MSEYGWLLQEYSTVPGTCTTRLTNVYQIRTLSAVLCCYLRVHVLKGKANKGCVGYKSCHCLFCSLQHHVIGKILLTRRFWKRNEAATPIERTKRTVLILIELKSVHRGKRQERFCVDIPIWIASFGYLQAIKSEDGDGGMFWLVWAIGCILYFQHDKIESNENLSHQILYICSYSHLTPFTKEPPTSRVVKKINAYSWIFHFYWLTSTYISLVAAYP